MSSKKIFLITGMMRTVHNWKQPIEYFKKHFSDFDIIPLDVQGMGDHYDKKSPLSISKNVEFLRKSFLEHKGEKNIFLGFSLGGMIISKWAQKYPKDISALILVTTSYGGLQPFWKRLKINIFPNAFMAFISNGAIREKYMYKMIAHNPVNEKRLINEWQKEQSQRPVSNLNVFRQAISGWKFRANGTKHAHPTLIIAAKNDQLVDYSCSEKLKEYLECDFICHDQAGHDVINEDFKWCAAGIKNWVYERKII